MAGVKVLLTVTETEDVLVQAAAFDTVTVNVPAVAMLMAAVVCPLDHW